MNPYNGGSRGRPTAPAELNGSALLSIRPCAACLPQLPVEAVEGYLKPLQARNWDKASLLQFRSFSAATAVPDYDAVRAFYAPCCFTAVQMLLFMFRHSKLHQLLGSACLACWYLGSRYLWCRPALSLGRIWHVHGHLPFECTQHGKQMKAPAVIIQGAEDAVVPTPSVKKALARLRARPPPAVTEYVELPRCGHIPQVHG